MLSRNAMRRCRVDDCPAITEKGINYKWSKDFMEAGQRRLAGDTARAATTDEVKGLRREAREPKEVVAEQTLELRLLKNACWASLVDCYANNCRAVVGGGHK